MSGRSTLGADPDGEGIGFRAVDVVHGIGVAEELVGGVAVLAGVAVVAMDDSVALDADVLGTEHGDEVAGSGAAIGIAGVQASRAALTAA
jgi:hypothetical protein